MLPKVSAGYTERLLCPVCRGAVEYRYIHGEPDAYRKFLWAGAGRTEPMAREAAAEEEDPRMVRGSGAQAPSLELVK